MCGTDWVICSVLVHHLFPRSKNTKLSTQYRQDEKDAKGCSSFKKNVTTIENGYERPAAKFKRIA